MPPKRETQTQKLAKLTNTELSALCEHNARKAETNDFKVPEWLWPFIEVVNRQNSEVKYEHNPQHFITVTKPV